MLMYNCNHVIGTYPWSHHVPHTCLPLTAHTFSSLFWGRMADFPPPGSTECTENYVIYHLIDFCGRISLRIPSATLPDVEPSHSLSRGGWMSLEFLQLFEDGMPGFSSINFLLMRILLSIHLLFVSKYFFFLITFKIYISLCHF